MNAYAENLREERLWLELERERLGWKSTALKVRANETARQCNNNDEVSSMGWLALGVTAGSSFSL